MQILEGTNKQDNLAVASMVETFLRQLHKELPFIEIITLQSDNAGCYQSNELLLLVPLISAMSPIAVSRLLHTETQDGKGLIDAHFARGNSHIEKFMRTSQRNKIRKIAIPKGLAAALAWGGGVQNSFVQLVFLDRKRLEVLRKRLDKICAESRLYFSRCNDCFFGQSETTWRIEDIILDNDKANPTAELKHKITAYAYSTVGAGVIFNISLNEKSFIPFHISESNDLDTEGITTVADDVAVIEDAEPNDDPHGTEQNDFILEDDIEQNNGSDTEEGITDIGENEEIILFGSHEQADNVDLNHEGIHAAENYGTYELPEERLFSSMLTGANVLKVSTLGTIFRPRTRRRAPRNTRLTTQETTLQRRDIISFAVRSANHRIGSNTIVIRDGREHMPEYDLCQMHQTPQDQKNIVGWARRPPRGSQYGVSYIRKYRDDVKDMFVRGSQVPADKLGPAAMLEKLQESIQGGTVSLERARYVKRLQDYLVNTKKVTTMLMDLTIALTDSKRLVEGHCQFQVLSLKLFKLFFRQMGL